MKRKWGSTRCRTVFTGAEEGVDSRNNEKRGGREWFRLVKKKVNFFRTYEEETS